MKKTIMTLAIVAALAACNQPKKANISKASLDSESKTYSYALGRQFGDNMKTLQVDIDKDILVASIEAALNGDDSVLTEEEIQQAMVNLRNVRVAQMKEASEANKAKGDEFLAANKDKEGVKVTDSGLQYKIIEEGTGKSPKATDRVKVHYAGTLIDGTEFDSSIKRGTPATFGVNGVIKGWTEALQMMKEGGKWKLFIPADLAYGPMDRPSIPGNSVLIFDVELLEVIKEEKKK
jgi:FKBP-type peptidyl-prolyl cis-trans isomerase FkpA/FKBP-type peptidyl-prolyl cis-trans isomerase FklB